MMATSDHIADAMNGGLWNVFRENLMADADERGHNLSIAVPTWDQLSERAKQAFDLSMRVNDIYLMIGAIIRVIVEKETAEQGRN